jgi:hypothetical protein
LSLRHPSLQGLPQLVHQIPSDISLSPPYTTQYHLPWLGLNSPDTQPNPTFSTISVYTIKSVSSFPSHLGVSGKEKNKRTWITENRGTKDHDSSFAPWIEGNCSGCPQWPCTTSRMLRTWAVSRPDHQLYHHHETIHHISSNKTDRKGSRRNRFSFFHLFPSRY